MLCGFIQGDISSKSLLSGGKTDLGRHAGDAIGRPPLRRGVWCLAARQSCKAAYIVNRKRLAPMYSRPAAGLCERQYVEKTYGSLL